MPSLPMTAAEVLDRHFLEARAKILDVAAIFDRIDRGLDSEGPADPRRRQLEQALLLLQREDGNRAEQVQMLFSRPYDPQWLAATDGLPDVP